MSGSVQKTIPEERFLRIEKELPTRKKRRRFLKNLRRLKKPGVKQPVAVAVVGQLPLSVSCRKLRNPLPRAQACASESS